MESINVLIYTCMIMDTNTMDVHGYIYPRYFNKESFFLQIIAWILLFNYTHHEKGQRKVNLILFYLVI